MNKAYNRQYFRNGQEPALDEWTMNQIDEALDTIDDRVIAHETAIAKAGLVAKSHLILDLAGSDIPTTMAEFSIESGWKIRDFRYLYFESQMGYTNNTYEVFTCMIPTTAIRSGVTYSLFRQVPTGTSTHTASISAQFSESETALSLIKNVTNYTIKDFRMYGVY